MFYFARIFLLLIIFVSTIVSCSNRSQQKDSIPFHDAFTIESKVLDETRKINVWLPDGYKKATDSLIIIYMADGGVAEDFPHIANTLHDLIKTNKIPPTILVGIENTQRRRDLSGPTEVESDKKVAPVVGGAPAFRSFIEQELMDTIEAKYRLNGIKGILGESLSGLFVTETFFLQPDLFDFYIAFDPSIWWNDKYLVRNASDLLKNFPKEPKVFWLANSQAKDIAPNVRELASILDSTSIPNLQWQHVDAKNEKHNTIFRATKEDALIWTLNKFQNKK